MEVISAVVRVRWAASWPPSGPPPQHRPGSETGCLCSWRPRTGPVVWTERLHKAAEQNASLCTWLWCSPSSSACNQPDRKSWFPSFSVTTVFRSFRLSHVTGRIRFGHVLRWQICLHDLVEAGVSHILRQLKHNKNTTSGQVTSSLLLLPELQYLNIKQQIFK